MPAHDHPNATYAWNWALNHNNYGLWKRFYNDAWKLARNLAAGTTFTTERVAYAIAALSPNKGWDQNVTLARRAVELAAGGENILDAFSTGLGAMRSRMLAAGMALEYGEIPNGPKVSAFAKNIAGDLSVVTVDRHMLDMFDGDRRACIKWCEDTAHETGMWPAEVQAILWGAWRDIKGYTTYNTGDLTIP